MIRFEDHDFSDNLIPFAHDGQHPFSLIAIMINHINFLTMRSPASDEDQVSMVDFA